MVLLSFLLVLAAAVTLVIGLLNGGLGLIYLSIACSLGAGIVLALAVMRSRPRAVPALGGPAPIAGGWGDEEPTAPRSVRRQEAAPTWGGQATAPAFDETTFPIAGYDGLKVTDILPLLPELEQDELELVRSHEAGAKNRSRILGRIEMLTAEASWDAPAEDWDAEAAPARAERSVTRTAASRRAAATIVEEDLDVADDGDFDDFDAGDDDDDFDDDDFDDDVFPIADYDELRVGEIMPLLPELDDDELDMVRDREARGQARAMIISRIDRLHGGPPAAPAKRTTAAKKTTAAKRPSAAKKTAATKRTAAAKKTTVAKRPTAKKAPAKKTAAKKRSATRSTAKKTASKRR